MHRISLLLIVGLSFVVGCAVLPGGNPLSSNKLSPEAQQALNSGTDMELFSLGSDIEPVAKGFHDSKILGQTKIDASKQSKVASAIRNAVSESDGSAAACFIPRHGIRVVHQGQTVDFVICFQCLQIKVYRGEVVESVLTGRSAEAVLDAILKDAGIELATKG